MITATCVNTECSQFEIAYYCLGNPDPVQCGECGQNDFLSDPQPDPTPPEPIEP